MNWHIWEKLSDPGDQMAWLESELRKAEMEGEKIITIGHIPPSDEDCLNEWSTRFRTLHERFQHVMRTTLWGHTHQEEFTVN